MDCTDIDDAAEALRKREGISTGRSGEVGKWLKGTKSPESIFELPEWATSREVEGVVWTALPPKYGDREKETPTIEQVLAHLGALTGVARDRAERYVRYAPRQVDTPYRRRIEAAFHWTCRSNSATAPIRRVGFFHFATDFKGQPIESLEEALEQFLKEHGGSDQDDAPKLLQESLLVVPEAFNLRFGYLNRDVRVIGGDIRDRLVDLSRRRGMAMVVGLLDDHSGTKPYNAAYLIDGGEPQMLSRKHNSDDSGNYSTCRPPSNCSDNVIPHRGLQIAALVCMDADQYPGQERRHQDILRRLDGPERKVLCVPSRFSRPPHEVVKRWPDLTTIVLANRSETYPSIVRLEKGVAIETPDYKKDHIEFWDLPEVQGA